MMGDLSMNLAKMVKVFDQSHDGVIVNFEKETNDLNIDVRIKYLAKHINETYDLLRYKIISFKHFEFSADAKNVCFDISEIKKMELAIIDAEIGFNHSLLVNVHNKIITKGKLYIWANYENDIKIYDQSNKEIEYDKFIDICRRK